MKKLVVVSIMAAMLLTVSVAVMADATNWLFKLSATTTAGLNPAGDCNIGWFKGYTNNTDTGETAVIPAPPAGGKNAVIAAVFAGSTTKTLRDFREPLSNAAGDYSKMALPRTWTFVVYTQGAWNPADKIRVNFKPVAGVSGALPISTLPNGAKIELAGAINAVYTAEQWAAKTTNWYFDLGDGQTLYTAENALSFTMTVTPEPSSMFALASGLAGLAGFAVRRRK